MIEFLITGTTSHGKITPVEHGMTTECVQMVVNAYVKKYPDVVHIALDIALDVTKRTVNYTARDYPL